MLMNLISNYDIQIRILNLISQYNLIYIAPIH